MDLSDSLRPAVVAILDDEGKVFGTGFFITSDGYILTCYHVIEDYLSANKVDIRKADGVELQAAFEEDKSSQEESIDFAILKVNVDGQAPVQCLPLGRDFGPGDSWYSLGYLYPLNFKCDSNRGTIISKSYRLDSESYDIRLETKFPIRGGLSGSPLLNVSIGQVIGVVKSRPTEDGNWEGFAVPMEDVFARWPELEKLNLASSKLIEVPQVLSPDVANSRGHKPGGPLAQKLTSKFPTLMTLLYNEALNYALARTSEGQNIDPLFDLHLLYLLQKQIPELNLTDEQKWDLLVLILDQIQDIRNISFIKHRALLLISDIAFSRSDFEWHRNCKRLSKSLEGGPHKSLDLGDHWLLSIAMLRGNDEVGDQGAALFESFQKSPDFFPGRREHTTLNVAEGLRCIIVAAHRNGKMGDLTEESILKVLRWIDLDYVTELKDLRERGASQIRLLLLCCDLVNIMKVCKHYPTAFEEVSERLERAKSAINNPRISVVADEIIKLGKDPDIAAWDLEPAYMGIPDFWGRPDNAKLKKALKDLYKVSIEERIDQEYKQEGWKSWKCYFKYLGLTSGDPFITEISKLALEKRSIVTSE